MPRDGPRSIVHRSCEKYFPTKFHHLYAKYAKEHKHYESKNYDQYFIKTVREVPGKPHEGPKIVLQSFGKKYFSTNSIIFARFVFIISKLPVDRSRHCDHQEVILYKTVITYPTYIRKIFIAKINLPLQGNRKNKIEKSFLGPKLNAGAKPSTRFPPEKFIKLTVVAVTAFKIQGR